MTKKHLGKKYCLQVIIVLLGISLLLSTGNIARQVSQENKPAGPSSPGGNEVDWWPMFHHDLQHTGYSTSTAPTTNNVQWMATLPNISILYIAPAVVHNKVYIVGTDINTYQGSIFCIDALNGTQEWVTTISEYIMLSSPAIYNGKLYIGSTDLEPPNHGRFYCIDADTGNPLWNFTADGEIFSSPAVVNEKVYFACNGEYPSWEKPGKIYCLDAETGGFIWSYTTRTYLSYTSPHTSSPALHDGKLYIGASASGHTGWFFCLNATDGTNIWNRSLPEPVFSSPVVTNERIYVGAYYDVELDNYGMVYCLDPTNGSILWDFYAIGGNAWSTPAVAGENVYIGFSNRSHTPPWVRGRVYCLNATTGRERWNSSTDSGVGSSSPAIADGKLYISGSGITAQVYCIDTGSGHHIWNYSTLGAASHVAIANGMVYAASEYGLVYAFGGEDMLPDANQSFVILTDSNMPGLTTCPAGDGLVYQHVKVTVKNAQGDPLSGIPFDQFEFALSPTDGTQWFGSLSCSFSEMKPETNENGEICFDVTGDTSIVGNITIQVTVQGVPINDLDVLPCKSFDFDTDGDVDLGDFTVFGQDYGKNVYRSDFTWDGPVGLADFVIFGQHWAHTN